MKRLEATIFGYVQGVSFRYYTQKEVNRLPTITGWVANRPDRTVQVVAEGQEAELKQLLAFLHQGSPAARVDRVSARWLPATQEFTKFQIRL